MSIKAIHTWKLKQADGETNVRTAESSEGLLARLLRRRLRKMPQNTLDTGVQTLETEVERQVAVA
jgi:hypothetical protein